MGPTLESMRESLEKIVWQDIWEAVIGMNRLRSFVLAVHGPDDPRVWALLSRSARLVLETGEAPEAAAACSAAALEALERISLATEAARAAGAGDVSPVWGAWNAEVPSVREPAAEAGRPPSVPGADGGGAASGDSVDKGDGVTAVAVAADFSAEDSADDGDDAAVAAAGDAGFSAEDSADDGDGAAAVEDLAGFSAEYSADHGGGSPVEPDAAGFSAEDSADDDCSPGEPDAAVFSAEDSADDGDGSPVESGTAVFSAEDFADDGDGSPVESDSAGFYAEYSPDDGGVSPVDSDSAGFSAEDSADDGGVSPVESDAAGFSAEDSADDCGVSPVESDAAGFSAEDSADDGDGSSVEPYAAVFSAEDSADDGDGSLVEPDAAVFSAEDSEDGLAGDGAGENVADFSAEDSADDGGGVGAGGDAAAFSAEDSSGDGDGSAVEPDAAGFSAEDSSDDGDGSAVEPDAAAFSADDSSDDGDGSAVDPDAAGFSAEDSADDGYGSVAAVTSATFFYGDGNVMPARTYVGSRSAEDSADDGDGPAADGGDGHAADAEADAASFSAEDSADDGDSVAADADAVRFSAEFSTDATGNLNESDCGDFSAEDSSEDGGGSADAHAGAGCSAEDSADDGDTACDDVAEGEACATGRPAEGSAGEGDTVAAGACAAGRPSEDSAGDGIGCAAVAPGVAGARPGVIFGSGAARAGLAGTSGEAWGPAEAARAADRAKELLPLTAGVFHGAFLDLDEASSPGRGVGDGVPKETGPGLDWPAQKETEYARATLLAARKAIEALPDRDSASPFPKPCASLAEAMWPEPPGGPTPSHWYEPREPMADPCAMREEIAALEGEHGPRNREALVLRSRLGWILAGRAWPADAEAQAEARTLLRDSFLALDAPGGGADRDAADAMERYGFFLIGRTWPSRALPSYDRFPTDEELGEARALFNRLNRLPCREEHLSPDGRVPLRVHRAALALAEISVLSGDFESAVGMLSDNRQELKQGLGDRHPLTLAADSLLALAVERLTGPVKEVQRFRLGNLRDARDAMGACAPETLRHAVLTSDVMNNAFKPKPAGLFRAVVLEALENMGTSFSPELPESGGLPGAPGLSVPPVPPVPSGVPEQSDRSGVPEGFRLPEASRTGAGPERSEAALRAWEACEIRLFLANALISKRDRESCAQALSRVREPSGPPPLPGLREELRISRLVMEAPLRYWSNDRAGALATYRESLALHGDDPPDSDTLAITLEGVGHLIMMGGGPEDAREALPYFVREDGVWSRLRGPESRMALMARYHRAVAMAKAGDRDAALALHLEVLDARRRNFGVLDRHTDMSRDDVKRLQEQGS
jgi:hypothetical protein